MDFPVVMRSSSVSVCWDVAELTSLFVNRLDYDLRLVDVTKAEQKEPWYMEINPNGRVPALTDILPNGQELKLFESGSIMQYLVDRYDKEHR